MTFSRLAPLALAGLLLLSTTMPTWAQSGSKIAVLDLQQAVLQTDLAQQQLTAMEQNEDYKALVTRIESLTSDLQSFQQDAEKNAMTWSEEKRTEKQEEAQTLRQNYQGAMQTLQRERQLVVQAIIQSMGEATQSVIGQLIEAEKITLLLDSQNVFHAAQTHDITNKVTELLNQKAKQNSQDN